MFCEVISKVLIDDNKRDRIDAQRIANNIQQRLEKTQDWTFQGLTDAIAHVKKSEPIPSNYAFKIV